MKRWWYPGILILLLAIVGVLIFNYKFILNHANQLKFSMKADQHISYVHIPDEHKLKIRINEENIVLEYNREGDKLLLWNKQASNLVSLYRVAETNAYVMQYKYNLYWIDGDEYSAYQLLNHEYNGYLYDDIGHSSSVIWGGNPIISSNGSQLLFYSTRQLLVEPTNQYGELWLKDLKTREEKVIYEKPYTFIGWIGNKVFVKSNFHIYEIDTKTGQTTKVMNSSIKEVLYYPFLIGQNVSGRLYVNDVLEVEGMYTLGPHYYIENTVTGNDQYVLVNSRTENNGQYVTVIDLKNKKYSLIFGLSGVDLKSSQWIDREQFMVHEYKQDDFISSYIYKIEDINVWYNMDKK